MRICGISHDITERKEVERRVSEFYSTVTSYAPPDFHPCRSRESSKEGCAGELSEKAAQLVKIGRIESDRLIRSINDILDIRKIESGRLELKLEPIDLTELVNRALMLFRRQPMKRKFTAFGNKGESPHYVRPGQGDAGTDQSSFQRH